MTKDELRKYRKNQIELRQIEEQISRLEAALLGGSPVYSDMPPTSQRAGDPGARIAKLMDLKDAYNAMWDIVIGQQTEIEKAIDSLAPTERTLMRARYVEGKKWEQIAVDMNYSIQRIWQQHGSALKTLEFIRVKNMITCNQSNCE